MLMSARTDIRPAEPESRSLRRRTPGPSRSAVGAPRTLESAGPPLIPDRRPGPPRHDATPSGPRRATRSGTPSPCSPVRRREQTVSALVRRSSQRTPMEGFDLQGESTSVIDLLRRIGESRRLLIMLARKDFFVRYRRASFGLMWAVVLPLFQAVVLALVFSHIARIHAGTNYPTFVYSGILPWVFFSSSLPGAVGSIVDGQEIATKIYFPRVTLPMVTVGA